MGTQVCSNQFDNRCSGRRRRRRRRRKRRWKWGLVWVPSAAADSPCPGLLGQATLAMHIYYSRVRGMC